MKKRPGLKSEGTQPISPEPDDREITDVRWVQRRSWISGFGGGISFIILALLVADKRSALGPWYFVILSCPWLLMIYAAYVSIRYWRCRHCGAGLPTGWWFLRKRKCLKCGRRFKCY